MLIFREGKVENPFPKIKAFEASYAPANDMAEYKPGRLHSFSHFVFCKKTLRKGRVVHFASPPLKMDGWKMILSFGDGNF